MFVRAATGVAGIVVAAVGLVLLVPLPELALPVLLLGLSLLSLEFEWAARWYARVLRAWKRVRSSPLWAKLLTATLGLALVVGVVYGLGARLAARRSRASRRAFP